jgi:hypothetical protein
MKRYQWCVYIYYIRNYTYVYDICDTCVRTYDNLAIYMMSISINDIKFTFTKEQGKNQQSLAMRHRLQSRAQ